MKIKGLIIFLIGLAFIAMIFGAFFVIIGSLKGNFTFLYTGIFTLIGAFSCYTILGIIGIVYYLKKIKK